MPDRPILIVEDDDDLRQTLMLYLEISGFQVRSASNGQEALEDLEKERPSLILLDMRMPVMDGWQFARELRARLGRAIPVVMMTAAADAHQRAQEIEAEAFIAKPFAPEDLVRLIQTFETAPSVSQPAL